MPAHHLPLVAAPPFFQIGPELVVAGMVTQARLDAASLVIEAGSDDVAIGAVSAADRDIVLV